MWIRVTPVSNIIYQSQEIFLICVNHQESDIFGLLYKDDKCAVFPIVSQSCTDSM